MHADASRDRPVDTAASTDDRLPLILGVGGTTRRGSTTERALRVALDAAAAEGSETVLITADDLVLPMFTPDPSARTPAARRLVALDLDLDGAVGQVADPAGQPVRARFLDGRRAISHALDAARHDRSHTTHDGENVAQLARLCVLRLADHSATGPWHPLIA